MAKKTEFWVEPTPLTDVNLTPTLMEEIYQNISVILTTIQGEVMLDRNFGINPDIIDVPMTVAKLRIMADVVEKVGRYEPRVKVLRVQVENVGVEAASAGTMAIRVLVELKETAP